MCQGAYIHNTGVTAWFSTIQVPQVNQQMSAEHHTVLSADGQRAAFCVHHVCKPGYIFFLKNKGQMDPD